MTTFVFNICTENLDSAFECINVEPDDEKYLEKCTNLFAKFHPGATRPIELNEEEILVAILEYAEHYWHKFVALCSLFGQEVRIGEDKLESIKNIMHFESILQFIVLDLLFSHQEIFLKRLNSIDSTSTAQ